jgi:hypothetical protein
MMPKWSLYSFVFSIKLYMHFYHLMSATCAAYLILLTYMASVTSVKPYILRITSSAVQFPVTSQLDPSGLRRNTIDSWRQHRARRWLSEQHIKSLSGNYVIIINIRVTCKIGSSQLQTSPNYFQYTAGLTIFTSIKTNRRNDV